MKKSLFIFMVLAVVLAGCIPILTPEPAFSVSGDVWFGADSPRLKQTCFEEVTAEGKTIRIVGKFGEEKLEKQFVLKLISLKSLELHELGVDGDVYVFTPDSRGDVVELTFDFKGNPSKVLHLEFAGMGGGAYDSGMVCFHLFEPGT